MPQERKYPSDSARQAAYRRRQAQARKQELLDPRLPSLPSIATLPGTTRWNTVIQRCADLLALVRDEMEAYFDDRTEAWQEGERGAALSERQEALSRFVDGLEEILL